MFLNARTLLLKFGRGGGPAFLVASVGFLITFFGSRVAPIPLFIKYWWGATYTNLSWPLWCICAFTTPLPVFLNLYWWGLAMKGIARMIRPKKA